MVPGRPIPSVLRRCLVRHRPALSTPPAAASSTTGCLCARTRILCTTAAGATNPCSPMWPCIDARNSALGGPRSALFSCLCLILTVLGTPWPFLQPIALLVPPAQCVGPPFDRSVPQQMQENGLALLYSALTLRTDINSTAAQVHHEPSGQHLRCIACAYATILTGAAFRLDALSQQTILGESIFILPRWPFR